MAHLSSGRFGDFYAGSLHLLTAIEHVIPIVALGLIAGQQGKRAARMMSIVLPLSLAAGVLIGINFPQVTFSIYVNGFSFLFIGGLIALRKDIPHIALITIAVFFGITHGYSNGTAFDINLSVLNYSLGVLTAGLIIIAIFSGLVLSFTKDWQKIAVRVAGSWIAAIGLITIPMILK